MANPNLTKENLRTFLRYEFDRGSTTTQAFENINNTYGEGNIGKATTYRWYEKFNNGEFSVEDAPRSGRPVEFDEGQLEELLEEDNRQTTRELAEQMGCCHGTIENHLKKMGNYKNMEHGCRFNSKSRSVWMPATSCSTAISMLFVDISHSSV